MAAPPPVCPQPWLSPTLPRIIVVTCSLTTLLCYNHLISLCLGGRDALFRSLIVKTSESLVHCEFVGFGRISGSAHCAPDPLKLRG